MAKGRYEEWLIDDNLLRIEGWKRNGLSDEQIAHNMGISLTTLKDWKNKYPPILSALKRGKEVVDLEVENALFKSAMGYEYEETIQEKNGDKKIIKKFKKYMPPNVTAQIFWLKNRKPEMWRDKPIEQQADTQEKHNAIIEAIKELKHD